MADRWNDLRFNASNGEWLARPLGDMRRALADLLAERDALAAEVERLRAALGAVERLHTTLPGYDVCEICYPQDHGSPCCTLREISAALTEETTDD